MPRRRLFDTPIVVLDTETTGFGREPTAAPVELGAMLLDPCGVGVACFSSLIRPDRPRRHPFCHLEILAPFLAAAGWTVVLYGAPFNPDPKE